MRTGLGIVFFTLLGLQIVLRYAWPSPAPTWTRVAIIACCVGVVLCLVIQSVVERVQRGKGDRETESPAE